MAIGLCEICGEFIDIDYVEMVEFEDGEACLECVLEDEDE